jgi:hypothetical protein
MSHRDDLKLWKGAILAATHPLAQVLIDVIPDIEAIIGTQPPIPVLPATENRLRFERVLTSFLQVMFFFFFVFKKLFYEFCLKVYGLLQKNTNTTLGLYHQILRDTFLR